MSEEFDERDGSDVMRCKKCNRVSSRFVASIAATDEVRRHIQHFITCVDYCSCTSCVARRVGP